MDQYTYEDQVIEANLGDRTDLTYDNDALDVLTELFDNADNNIPDEILNTSHKGSPQLPHTDRINSNHTLPDSPPYSGSEAYSPESNNTLSPSARSDSSGYHSSPRPQTFQPEMNQQQLHNHLLHQQQLQQQQQHMQQLHERQLLQQHLQQQAALQNGGQMIMPAMMQRAPQNVLPQIVTDTHIPVSQPYNPDAHAQYASKKRKYASESPPMSDNQMLQQHQQLQQLQVKQEPVAQPAPPPCEYEPEPNTQSMDISPGMLNTGSYQPIKWREFQKQSWCPVVNAQGHRVNIQTYRLDGDKGFNFSQIDKAFVCQKKNHFQITSCLSFTDAPQYVMSQEGAKPVEGLFMHFYGVKEEAPNQVIQVDQSQADRSKRKFDPVPLHINAENSWKVTIGRLHFSDTTLNNMRKRGKPNPDQRYFLLVVGIFAHSQGKEYPIIQQCSEKLIVRASNPGQFQDSEAEPVKWQPGQTPNSVFHSGKVGINTDSPDEALTVAGNVKVMGNIMQPSDQRVKEDITKADTKEQLKNVQAISLYNYKYTDEFADAVGLDDKDNIETGVIAQELEVVIPDAVKTTTDVRLPNGEVIDKLKVVDKNRLFMESLGAVKELCNVTDSLENKITYLERFNQKLKKLKRIGSLRSTASNESSLSRVTSISTVSHVTVHKKRRADRCSSAITGGGKGEKLNSEANPGVCSNKFLQILIFVLIFVMLACVGVIVAMLYFDNDAVNNGNMREGTDVGLGQSSLSTTFRPTDTFTTTTSPLIFEAKADKWLVEKGCAEDVNACDWNHCTNQCNSFANANSLFMPFLRAQTTEESDEGMIQVKMNTQPTPAYDSVIYYTEKSSNDDTEDSYTSKRRKRSIVKNPAEALDLTLDTSPSKFKITRAQCVDCETNIYNYTYGVMVSHSFPATNVNLTIRYPGNLRPWRRVAMCPTPTEPAAFFNTPCDASSATNRDMLFNVSPTAPPNEPQQIGSQEVKFEVPVGKSLKNVAVFRLTSSSNIQTAEDLCNRPLNQYVVEFRVWFVRMCYFSPPDLDSLKKVIRLNNDLDSATSGPSLPSDTNTGSTNLDSILHKPN